jgi:hypothetical protein
MKGRPIFVGILTLGLLLAVAGSAGAGSSRQGTGNGEVHTVSLAVPGLITYQGRLVDAAGNPVADGPYSMMFRLYDVAAGGTAGWTETKAVTVTGGLFTTLLGDTTALDVGLFDGRDLWLGVQVAAEAEMTPRQRIASVPYAFHSYNADALDGAHASAFAPSSHDHDSRYVNVDGDMMRGSLARTPLLDVANSGTGVRLSSVTSSTIGGTATGAGNVFSNCTTGIFASGICTNTKLVKNTFVGTKTPYSVSGSRGITVVK